MAGNSSTKFVVNFDDMGGWVRVTADGSPANPDELAMFLSLGLAGWFRQHPGLRLIAVTSVSRGGETVELHAWYEQHSFPDKSGLSPTP